MNLTVHHMRLLLGSTRLFWLIAFVCSAILVQADENGDYWISVLQKQGEIYQAAQNTKSHETYTNQPNIGEKMRQELVVRLNGDPPLARLVRNSLRGDSRPWVREFSIAMLIKAFGKDSSNDVIFALSDPDPGVRSVALVGIRAAKIEDAAYGLPVGLLSKNPNERWSAVSGIWKFMGGKGLPYYSVMLYDEDMDVASEAAEAFQSCKKEDAAPLLLRYLKQFGTSKVKEDVTKSVIDTLNQLYGISASEKFDLKQAVDYWIHRIEGDISGQITNSTSQS